ncbi:sporulation protein [Oscillibacter sp. MSJ-2]|uniref:Sporulation protein n=1 Tax=Dysosmobacter acutus TaxID=2841504 RepID=A0ABS6F7F0_9FIRM|nr:nucleoside recognition domain-containing protein [Dysosmobacter acutus]MBU5626206.1 sporulation protein [Dysosmobacter acutus]
MKRKLLYLFLLLTMAALLYWSQDVRAGVQEGISLCLQSAIPSLFPFFVVSSLLIDLGFADALGRRLEGLMQPLFHVGGAGAAALALGVLGGYPVGAGTAAALYSQQALSRDEAQRLLAFCNNCSPAFAVNVLGLGVFGSGRIGFCLWLIHVLAALLTGLFFRGKRSDLRGVRLRRVKKALSFSEAFVKAAGSGARSMAGVCAFIILFSVALLPLRRLGGETGALLIGFTELFNGAALLSADRLGFLTAAGLLGWGGLSVHCQTLSVIPGLSSRYYWMGKSIQCLLCVLLAAAASPLFF